MPPATTPLAFEARLAAAWPPSAWQNVRVVLAVSGGPDSVALARAMARLASTAGVDRLVLAHFNHRLRGPDADADEHFVRGLAERLGVGFRVGSAPGGALEHQPDGVEAAARQARYAFLLATAEEWGARYVVTAHSADDQAETILHRILRGTGLAGLAGIPRARLLSPAVTLLRPMLDIRRCEVLAYLDELGQTWRTDGSNEARQFTRARIRHDLLPLLAREFNSDVGAALLRLGTLAGEAQRVIESHAGQVLERALVSAGGPHPAGGDRGDPRSICLHCESFRGVERHLAREVFTLAWRRQGWPLQDMGFLEWDQLAGLALSESVAERGESVREFPGGVRVIRASGELTLLQSKR